MHQPRRAAPAPRTPPPRGSSKTLALGAGAAVILAVALFWIFRGPDLSSVTNLDSSGTAVVAFGDSLTYGVGAADEENYPSRLAAATGLPILNAGRSGDTSAAALGRIDDDVLAHDPRIVIVGLGGNDFLQNVQLAKTEANLREIVKRVQDAGAMVVLLGFDFPRLRGNYAAMYERVAEEEGCLLIEDVLDGILSDPALRADPIHPNGNGYAIMAERVAGPVAELIEAAEDR